MPDFYIKQLVQLVGAKVTKEIVTPPDEFGDQFFGLQFQLPDGTERELLILRDDEGNGPGSFDLYDPREG